MKVKLWYGNRNKTTKDLGIKGYYLIPTVQLFSDVEPLEDGYENDNEFSISLLFLGFHVDLSFYYPQKPLNGDKK